MKQMKSPESFNKTSGPTESVGPTDTTGTNDPTDNASKPTIDEVDKLADELVDTFDNERFRKWYCLLANQFGTEQVRIWLMESTTRGANPARYFSAIAKKAQNSYIPPLQPAQGPQVAPPAAEKAETEVKPTNHTAYSTGTVFHQRVNGQDTVWMPTDRERTDDNALLENINETLGEPFGEDGRDGYK